jgi:beta-glucosidase
VEPDTDLVAALGVSTHRLGIEWARIEPEPGRFDSEAMDRYRHEVQLLLSRGISPLVTLHHFTNPIWLEARGGWMRHDTGDRFVRYAEYVVRSLGDLVTDWVTINEPNVYLLEGYVFGEWPPGRSSVRDYLRGSRIMVRAHERAYHAIHRIQPGRFRVGVAHHIRRFEPSGGIMSRLVCHTWDRVFHHRFVDPMSESSDFVGINYYTRDIIRPSLKPSELFGTREVPVGSETNDLGWEIHPPGLYDVVAAIHGRSGLPVYITENGICDREDACRARFIYDHLWQVRRLIADGIPVKRYYYWTLIDNFEWALGETARFGLYRNNFQTQERTLRKSGEFYTRICRTRRVDQQTIDEFLVS